MSKGQNAGHYQLPGTDRHNDGEPKHDAPYLAYRAQWADLPARFEVAPFPLHLDIESTNNCNLRCEYCSRNNMTDAVGHMDFDLFRKIIDEGAGTGLASIKLNRRGEPLLHPELPRMIRYAKNQGILEVQFNTNAMLLTAEKAEELIDSGLDRIIFSLDGTDPGTFERLRPGARYETVVNNIREFVRMRDAKGMTLPATRVQMTTSEVNVHMAGEYVQLWKDVVNRIGFNLERTPQKADGVSENFSARDQYPCPQLYQRMAIYYNGDTVMCCGDWHKQYQLGNVKDTSIQEMWTGKAIQRVRDLHRTDRINEMPLCAACEYNVVRDDSRLVVELNKIGQELE